MLIATNHSDPVTERSARRRTKPAELPTQHSVALQQLLKCRQAEQQRRKLGVSGGRIDWVEEQSGARCRYAYNSQGDLIQIIEPDGRSTRYDYDRQRRLIRVHHPNDTFTRYHYGDNDRLTGIDDRGVLHQFHYTPRGYLSRMQRGNAGTTVFNYDHQGRLLAAHTARVEDDYVVDSNNRITAFHQSINGVTLSVGLSYDTQGRLRRMLLPGSTTPIRYYWDTKDQLTEVRLGEGTLVTAKNRNSIDSANSTGNSNSVRLFFANGVIDETVIDAVKARPHQRHVRRDTQQLFQQSLKYTGEGQISSDGEHDYTYDAFGRLLTATTPEGQGYWHFAYDAMDNRLGLQHRDISLQYDYDKHNRLARIASPNQVITTFQYDLQGRLISETMPEGQRSYRYDDAGRLISVYERGDRLVDFTYDYKDRLVLANYRCRTERYLYGPSDELLAVTDAQGRVQRLYIASPLGYLAEVHGSLEHGPVYFHHNDSRGTTRLITDNDGRVVARYNYAPFGEPSADKFEFVPFYTGHPWHAAIGLYYFGARWYQPRPGRFLTPDTYTGAPDDARLVHSYGCASEQALHRMKLLNDWLSQAHVRNTYVYCNNDPVNRVDPNGHWSAGWTLLYTLSALTWGLPNSLIGLMVEFTCLIGEVIRWLVYALSWGNVTWENPSFDAAVSSRLNTYALVFEGGWLGSIPRLGGITFGNTIFASKHWRNQHPFNKAGVVYPAAYRGKLSLPYDKTFYEHELRHSNQQAWWGLFYFIGLPVFGAYVWDIILSGGYQGSWFERDANQYSGLRQYMEGKVIDAKTRDPIANVQVNLHKTTLKLSETLACFDRPDTKLNKISDVSKGDYPVILIKHSNNNTDYVKIRLATLPKGEGWICSRWKNNHYALLFDQLESSGIAETSDNGEFSFSVEETQMYRLRFVQDNYFDAESDRIPPSITDVEIKMEACVDAVKESNVIKWLSDFAGYRYTYGIPKYPFELWQPFPDNLKENGNKKNSCNAFTEALLVKSWTSVFDGNEGRKLYKWNLAKHEIWMIPNKWDSEDNKFASDEFGPVTQAQGTEGDDVRMGVEIDDIDAVPPPWTLLQGWSKWDPKPNDDNTKAKDGSIKGHSLLIIAVHPETKRVLTLESNRAHDIDGPGFRKLGDLDDNTDYVKNRRPSKFWWQKKDLHTWDEIKNIYTHRKMARLKIKDLRWLT